MEEISVSVGTSQLDKPKPRQRNTPRTALTKADKVIEEAKRLQEGERRCNGKSKVRDENGEVVMVDGKALRKPCELTAMMGSTVCHIHGNTKNIKAKAKQRMRAALDPALVRLEFLAHQNAHLPTALGATKEIINRNLGAVGSEQEGDARPRVQIGILNIGGVSADRIAELVQQKALTAAPPPDESEDDSVDGEVVGEDEE